MSKSSVIGKNHVIKVSQALRKSLAGHSIESFPDTVIQTVNFIRKEFPHIHSFFNKYETDRPDDYPSLQLQLTNQQEVKVNLFTIRGTAAIQPKNLGAKSFLKKYFCSEGLQAYFNDYIKKEYTRFLREILSLQESPNDYDGISLLKRKVDEYYPRFNCEINPLRTAFLFNLREYCFKLLTDQYNVGAQGIQHAFNELMMLHDTTIITRYRDENKCLGVERWQSGINSTHGVKIYKKGNDTIGIRAGNEALTIRFKFESSPTSSLKIATSYEFFPEDNKIVQQNLRSIDQFETYIHEHVEKKGQPGKPDAIGKCNEAMVYYRILKENLAINQIEQREYHELLRNHYEKITPEELTSIYKASVVTTEQVYRYLTDRYTDYEIESIQLVTQSYLANRSDTSDLQLVLLVNGKYKIESFSLKAIARRNTKITNKNPGAGRILGPTYFDIGSLVPVIEETEKKFKQGLLNHRKSLEAVSAELDQALLNAPQEKLKQGVSALLGDKPTVLTIYFEEDSLLLEYDAIQDQVEVYPNQPSAIQTTLRWNDHQEELSLRVKFSRGQKYGWSSLKLTCEYRVNYK